MHIPILDKKSETFPLKRHLNASIQTLIKEFKSVVSRNVELQYQYIFLLKALLTFWANQDFNSDVENKL